MALQIYMTKHIKHNQPLKLAFLIITTMILSGCASLSKSECNTGDWAKIGNNDGSRGLVANRQLSKHQKACSEYNISPNINTYNSGYVLGLKKFCRREVGLSHGSNGAKYLATCPANLEREFLRGYVLGLELTMDNLDADIDDLERKNHRLNRKLDHTRYSHTNSHKDRKAHKKYRKKLENRLSQVESDIRAKFIERNKLRSWHSRWLLKLR